MKMAPAGAFFHLPQCLWVRSYRPIDCWMAWLIISA